MINEYKYYDNILLPNVMAMVVKEFCDNTNEINKVIYNNPATIILWEDKTKTVVICDKEDKYDETTGFLLCYLKKMLGTKKFHKVLSKYIYNNNTN